jgi:hypothetical protein
MATLRSVYTDTSEIDRARAEFADGLAMLRRLWDSGAVSIAEAVAAVGLNGPFLLAYQGGDDRLLQAAHGQLVAEIMGRAISTWASCGSRRWCLGEQIRVGFVSGCFWRHSVWRLPMRGWVENLDRSRFRLFGYHTRTERDDQTEHARALFDQFQEGPKSVTDWVRTIERDLPHVLIYPEIGADGCSRQLAGLRLAPVQCAAFGQPVSSGYPTIDYFLSSDLMEPHSAERHYTERLVRLPGITTAYGPSWATWGDPSPSHDAWASIGLPEDSVRFLCCQNLSKYLPTDDDVFPRIAARLPTARFVFVEVKRHPTAVLRRRLDAAFAKLGMRSDEFCRFVPGMSSEGFSALVRDADVFLDTIGWSGFNTTLDAVAHGVPVVTLPGEFMRGRHSAAILTAAGVADTIARSVEDYIDLAVKLGGDAEWRQVIGGRLRANAERVFNDLSPVRELEDLLQEAVAQRPDGRSNVAARPAAMLSSPMSTRSEAQQCDRVLLRLLKTPPQPRPQRKREELPPPHLKDAKDDAPENRHEEQARDASKAPAPPGPVMDVGEIPRQSYRRDNRQDASGTKSVSQQPIKKHSTALLPWPLSGQVRIGALSRTLRIHSDGISVAEARAEWLQSLGYPADAEEPG